MPVSLRSPLFLDVVVGVVGTLSFLLDLAADLWAVVQYALGGRYLWAALVVVLLCLASVLLQLFSWVWLTTDPTELHKSLPSRRFLTLLHVLQLGYLYRCLHGLQQGLALLQQELPTESDIAYADFLSLDISMLRLFESFLEATPQLTLVLAIVLKSGQAEYYQYMRERGATGYWYMLWLHLFSILGFKVKISLITCMSACITACQKREPDLIVDGCEPPCSCWELNSGRGLNLFSAYLHFFFLKVTFIVYVELTPLDLVASTCLPLNGSLNKSFFFLFQDRVSLWLSWNSLCRPDWPLTHRDPPASASRVLGLKVCTATTTTHSLNLLSALFLLLFVLETVSRSPDCPQTI
ncbi:XK-related protein 8 isoform X2 [Alexandromys fortis]|uniref:XK-related protein 8 isoform X2 n=1 Tax=Alexandromys fortis TaxID=100897 RepID=UPI002152FA8B|nr:XK-related protein 8 isoform X2 [Microtus fortis]